MISEQDLKLRLRKNDFDRVHGLEQKKEYLNAKEKIEALYKQRLEEEKRKMMRGRMEEFEVMIQENRELKEEIGRLKISLSKLTKNVGGGGSTTAKKGQVVADIEE
jgi:SMC interacting uncharacterized protein involved in chromosome segregation